MKKKISLGLALSVAAVSLMGFGGPATAAAKPTLTAAVQSPIQSWQATYANLGSLAIPYQLVYDTLLTMDEKGNIKPNLASSYAYDKSFKKLTLTLRTGVKFTDGTPVNASAVVANLNAFKTSTNVNSGLAASITKVAAGTKPNTVVISLKDTDPGLLPGLTMELGMIESPRQITAADAKTKPVGSGAYVLDTANSVVDSSYVFTPNASYWNKSVQRFSKVTVKILTDGIAISNALKAGQIDMGPVNNANTVESLKAAGVSMNNSNDAMSGLSLVDRTGRMGTILKDVRVRQAINYALNRDVLLAACGSGQGTISSSIFPKSSAGYSAAIAKTYDYNLDKAKSLMEAAGVKTTTTITMLDMSGFNKPCMDAIVQMLGAINIKIVGDTSSTFATVFQDLQRPKWPMFWFNLPTSSVDWVFINQDISRDAPWNQQGFGTNQTDQLIQKIRSSTGAAQKAAYTALNKAVTDGAWFAPFYLTKTNYGFNASKVKVWGAGGTATPNFPFGVTPAGK